MPEPIQWIAFVATLVGAGMAMWAAFSAKGAKRRALEAKQAAVRLGNMLQLADLLQDMQELETMLARDDFRAIAAKASHLRGRIERFRWQMIGYNLSSAEALEGLDGAKIQLEIIGRVAVDPKRKLENRPAVIHKALAEANEQLNRVAAIQHVDIQGTGT